MNDLDDVCNIATYVVDTNMYSKCDQASDMWQQLELPSELESDLQEAVDWLVDFNAGKSQLVLLDKSTLMLLL